MSGFRFPSLGLVCLVTLPAGVARAQDAPSQPTSAPTSSAPEQRKVWTNEDVPTLREDSAISSVGSPRGTPPAAGTQRNTPGHHDAKWYVDQITKLEGQLPPIHQKIAQLEAGIEGKFTGDSQTSTRPKSVTSGSWQEELAQLQKQRDDIEARISALRDEARHQGVSPNALP